MYLAALMPASAFVAPLTIFGIGLELSGLALSTRTALRHPAQRSLQRSAADPGRRSATRPGDGPAGSTGVQRRPTNAPNS